MSGIVIDGSVTMAWCFEDESDDYSEATLDYLRSGTAEVPSIWMLDVSKALSASERSGGIAQSTSTRFLELLRALPIDVQCDTRDKTWNRVMDLGRQFDLSPYNACYLELAMRRGAELATRDLRLMRAAERAGVPIFGRA